MPQAFLPPGQGPAPSALERLLLRLFGLLVWMALAAMGLLMVLGITLWLLLMTVVNLVTSLFTGRPAAVTLLWRGWREATRQRWPQRRPASATPRADAASATGAAQTGQPPAVQDVAWRDLPPR